ncbi:MAG: ParA family protein [Cyanobacteria bacterium J06600_6]
MLRANKNQKRLPIQIVRVYWREDKNSLIYESNLKMVTIGLCNLKGGVSKSLTAVHLAAFLARHQRKVLVIDCDMQQSSAKWLAKINEPLIEVFTSDDMDDIEDALLDLSNDFDYVVVDTGANATAIMDMVMSYCDHVLIPTQPGELDGDSTELTIKRLLRAKRRKPSLTGTVFLARVFKNTITQRQTIERFENYEGITLSPAQIVNTQRLIKLVNTHQTALDAAGCKDLALEFTKLFTPLLTTTNEK